METQTLEQRRSQLMRSIDSIVNARELSISMRYTGSLSKAEENDLREYSLKLVASMNESDVEYLPKIIRSKVVKYIVSGGIAIGVGAVLGAACDAHQGADGILAGIGGFCGLMLSVRNFIPRLLDYRDLTHALRGEFYKNQR